MLGSPSGRPVRFRVTLDGKAPGADAGSDIAADGSGAVSGERLYQLVRQKGDVRERTFTIHFLDPGVEGLHHLRLATMRSLSRLPRFA